VTGGLGGLGLGLVQTLLQSGADVVVTDMAPEPSVDTWSKFESTA
jgi:NAD(P)-dependent dehydrogenase (short-subunit alcohol dehydrogenase family)